MDTDPTKFGTPDRRIPKPKTLEEFYNILVAMFPEVSHDTKQFFDSVVKCYKKPHIEFQYRNRRMEIEENGFKYKIPQNIPNNEIWNGALDYLESLDVSREEIRKLTDAMPNRV